MEIDIPTIISSIIVGIVLFIFKRVFYLNHKVTELSTKINSLKEDVDYISQNLKGLSDRIDKIYELLVKMDNNTKKRR